jgi:hypothetical protein
MRTLPVWQAFCQGPYSNLETRARGELNVKLGGEINVKEAAETGSRLSVEAFLRLRPRLGSDPDRLGQRRPLCPRTASAITVRRSVESVVSRGTARDDRDVRLAGATLRVGRWLVGCAALRAQEPCKAEQREDARDPEVQTLTEEMVRRVDA